MILCYTILWGFPCGSAGKESPCSSGDLDSIPGLGRSPGEERGYPLQYSDLENSPDCIVLGVAKSRTRLSHFHFHSILYCTIPYYTLLYSTKLYYGEGNGNPLQCSCLENPMDRGAW